MKKTFLGALALSTLLLTSCSSGQPKQPKYIFYLILDGTGASVPLGLEMMRGELQGRWGRDTLCMASFPVVGFATTYSASSGVTDSAASGTCLATGTKTYNSALGVGPDTLPVYSIAYKAHLKGIPVGVASSVGVNHATPASFYAHVSNRNKYAEVAMQALASGYDFLGGSDFILDSHKYLPGFRDSLYQACADSGYVIARSIDDYVARCNEGAERMIFFQSLERTLEGKDYSLPYLIDTKPGELTVYDITRAEIDFLYRKSELMGGCGFFLMNEIGGRIDHACHANDAATTFREVALADSCVRLAYDFYLQHPDETLIVVTSDHDTGGMSLGRQEGGYNTHFALLAHQHCSLDAITSHFQQLRSETRNRPTWEQVQAVLAQDLDFWCEGGVPIDDDEMEELKKLYTRSFVGKMPSESNLYSDNEPMAAHAVRILNRKAFVGWTSMAHTASLVPVYAIGVGAEQFMGHCDNSDFAPKMARIAGYE